MSAPLAASGRSKEHNEEPQNYTEALDVMRHLRCMVLPPIIITKCTDGKHRNYDLIIIILWNNHYNLNEDEKHDYQFYHA